MKKWISVLLSFLMTITILPTSIFAEENNANELPEGYIDTSNDELYSIINDDSAISLLSSSENAGKKVEIAFIIDTTSSMSGAIASVKNNVTEFAKYLEEQGVNLRMSVVEYRDITADGLTSTKVHTVNHTPWHSTTAQLVETLSSMSVDGGGDGPETVIDALGCLTDPMIKDQDKVMRWSSDAYKFAFVLTDANYKINNTHGITDMNQMISALNARGISTSVITASGNYSAYKELVDKTGGQLADINSSDYLSELKKLADNALSNTVKKESVDVVVQAINDKTYSMENVSGAIVSLFVDDEVRYFTTDDDGIAHIELNNLSERQLATATISAHKSWTGTVGKTDGRYPLIKRFGTDTGSNAERYIYELHSEYIDENGNWCGKKLINVIRNNENILFLSEPRLLVNMSVCYYEPSNTSNSDKSIHHNAVKAFMSNLSQELAQSTDGHIMINKVLIGSTNERTDFYINANQLGSDPDYTSTTLASMADIRIEASKNEQTRIHSNAHIQGFFRDNAYLYIDDLQDGKFKNFSNLSNDEIIDLNGKFTFPRIQESWNASESYYTLDNNIYITTTHESGHYIMSFYDEYMDGNEENWTEYNFWADPFGNKNKNPRPDGAPKNFGLMDHQYDGVELSTQYEYRYLDSIGSKDYDTKQSYMYNKSCEDLLRLFLERGYIEYSQAYIDEFNEENKTSYTVENSRENLIDINYKANYTTTNAGKKRYTEYSYAKLSDDKFTEFDGSIIDSEVSVASLDNYTSEYSERYNTAKITSDDLAEMKINTSGEITITPYYNNIYSLYYYDSISKKYHNVSIEKVGSSYVGNIDISAGGTYELYLITNDMMNTYQIEISRESRGYLYESLDGSIMSYVISESPCNHMFIEDNISRNNDDYKSINKAINIISSNDSKGELYSVASVNDDIDYTTISWFKLANGVYKKIDTDLSVEENMNIGARCDYAGEGTYVLMAKKAADNRMSTITNLDYTNLTDRDGIVNLTFDDSNENSQYYNIYYSNKKFTSTDDENVVMQKNYAGADSYRIDFGKRDIDGYVAVVAVAADGSKSSLSEVIKVNTGEADRDEDGVPDWYCDEYLLWPPTGAEKDIANSDDDEDGLTNLEEYKGGSDPTDQNDPVKTENVAVKSVSLSSKKVSLKKGKTDTISASIDPSNATNKNVQWYIDDTSVATIKEDGRECTITGVKAGTTKITVVTEDGGYTASADVTVTDSSSTTGGTSGGTGGGGGGGGNASATKYTLTVSYIDENGDVVDTETIRKESGTRITEDDLSIPKGYELKDDDFSVRITKNTTVKINVVEVKTQSNPNSNKREEKFINGYSNGNFEPDNNITRAEVAMIIYNMTNTSSTSYKSYTSRFSDISASHWAANAMGYNISKSYMSGDGSNRFRPDDNMTRAELAQLLYNLDIADTSSKTVSLSDISNHWGETAISAMAKAGVISGYSDGTFKPNNNVTRAEAVTMIARLFKRSEKWTGNTKFKDVSSSHWAYKTIMNAANGYEE